MVFLNRFALITAFCVISWFPAHAAWLKSKDVFLLEIQGKSEAYAISDDASFERVKQTEYFAVYKKTVDEYVFHIKKISFLPEAFFVIVNQHGEPVSVFMTVRTFRDSTREQELVGFTRALVSALQKAYGKPTTDYYMTYFKHKDETLFNCLHRYTLRHASQFSLTGIKDDDMHPNSSRCLPPDECLLRTDWRKEEVEVNLSAVAYSPQLVTLRLTWQNKALLKDEAQNRDFYTLLTSLLLAVPE